MPVPTRDLISKNLVLSKLLLLQQYNEGNLSVISLDAILQSP